MKTWYYFKTTEDSYIGIDQDSGGYWIATRNPNSIFFFPNAAEAMDYRRTFLTDKSLSSQTWTLISINF